jgi:hypothetical protein
MTTENFKDIYTNNTIQEMILIEHQNKIGQLENRILYLENRILSLEKIDFEEKRKRDEDMIISAKNNPDGNLKYKYLSDNFRDLTHYKIGNILDKIQKKYSELDDDDQLIEYLGRFLINNENLKENLKKESPSSFITNLKELSLKFTENFKYDFNEKFKKNISDVDIDLSDFLQITYEIENSDPTIDYIHPKLNRANFKSEEHELYSKKIKITNVICPGIKSKNLILVKAKVKVKIE